MIDEFPTPHDELRRKREWPRHHDIGIYMSAGDSMLLVGTARDSLDLSILFRGLADEWDRMLGETDWFFTDLVG